MQDYLNSNFIYQNLKRSRHFQGVSDRALRKFLNLTEFHRYKKGKVILEQGEWNHNIYILVNGAVTVEVDDQYIYDLKRNGDIFGEMSVIRGEESSATISAKENVDIISISKEKLTEIQDDSDHGLHYIFYQWFSLVLVEKLHLTSQKAKLHEEAQNSLEQKNKELESKLKEL